VDVSFISLRQVLPRVFELLAPGGRVIALLKPQFEAGKGEVGKGGVIRERNTHLRVLREIAAFLREARIAVRGLMPSPLRGPAGNIEFLLLLEAGEGWPEEEDMRRVVEKAWEA
jgi:23S rRNA (cytidine1920-2'-O)/16S rRNA (cytidine1409-2'-O)-methyltransferase